MIKSWLGTNRLVDPIRLDYTEFRPWVFALSLSRINRYCGNGKFPYSVAQHSVLLSDIVPEELAKAALIHDCPEVFIGDINGLLKTMCPQIIEYEEKVLRRIGRLLKIEYADFLRVTPWDKQIRKDEMSALFDTTYPEEQLLGVEVYPWTHQEAASRWLDRFHFLFTSVP